jgi:protein-S-isoprenylcysteine O-methyltransferase Ste14
MVEILTNLIGMGLTWGIWLWLVSRRLSAAENMVVAYGGALAVIPLVLSGRWLLDRQPDVRHAHRVTLVMHYLLAIFLGSALLSAARLGLEAPAWPVPLPPWLGLAVMFLSGLVLVAIIFYLVLKGLGSPFAVTLTRTVVTDWAYAWTRNPMVLSSLAFLVGLGLWLGSGLFLIWLLAVVSPAVLVFLKVYEERELEIRFGKAYTNYKIKTSMIWPRRPR